MLVGRVWFLKGCMGGGGLMVGWRWGDGAGNGPCSRARCLVRFLCR